MANTPKGYPYPLGTDRVMDGDNVIAALATAVDTKLGNQAAGVATISTPANGTASLAVTFPAGRFTGIPVVTCSLTDTTSMVNYTTPAAANATATGCQLWINRTGGSSSTMKVSWHAAEV